MCGRHGGFNPHPAFLRGESLTRITPESRALVSIHTPHFCGVNQDQAANVNQALDVSIHTPHFCGVNPAESFQGEQSAQFQSTPRISAG